MKSKIFHSSLSEHLSVVEPDYFKQLYGEIYRRFSALYPAKTIGGLKLQRVDSSPVAEASNRLAEGMTFNNGHKSGKMLKYTVTCDGMYGSCAQTHTEEKYASESLSLPENVLEHFKKTEDRVSVYLFDRGQPSTAKFVEMKSQNGLLFAGRLLESRELHIVREFDLTFKRFAHGELKMDASVQLYKKETITGKRGKEVRKLAFGEEIFRVIRFRPKGEEEDILLITGILYFTAQTEY